MRYPFVGGTNTSRSVNVSAQRTINWYVELDPRGKFPASLQPRPGLKLFASGAAGEIRGQIVFSDDLFNVAGDQVQKISTSGAVTALGVLGTSSGWVSMAKGKTQLLLVDGNKGYVWDGSTLTAIADAQFPNGATTAAYIDGYFLVNDPDNAGRFYQSAKGDATSWDALDFATAERSPDALLRILIDEREIWLFGSETTEVWGNDGSSDFSFSPMSGGFTEVGIAAPQSAAVAGSFVYWLATAEQGQNAVFRAAGFKGERISTPAIEEDIAAAGDVSGAIGETIYFRGHLFYVLTLPNGKTLVHDSQSNEWTEWKTYLLDRFRGQHFVLFNKKTYCGDYQDGTIFEFDADTYTDNGLAIERVRRDRHIVSSEDRRDMAFNEMEIEFEAGVGLTNGLDPQAMLRWSDDGGHTWSNEHWRSIGKLGEYTNRSRWLGLGTSYDRIFEVKITDPVKAVLVGGWVVLD